MTPRLCDNPGSVSNASRKTSGSTTGIVFAIYNIGSIPAVFFTGPVNDYWGRRMGMFIGALIIVIGTCIQAPSVNRGMFLAGRFILGFGVSFCSVSAPCYVSEIAHPAWRYISRLCRGYQLTYL